MKPPVNVRIVQATEEDSRAIEEFLKKYFFPDEPLNRSLGRLPEEVPFLAVLKDRLSFKAVVAPDDSQEILAGVVLNKEVSITEPKELSPKMCPKQLKIKKILKELDEKSRIWEVVNYEKHFNIVAVAVKDSCRGFRIGQKLAEESLKLAKSLGHKFATIECSGFYSAKFAAETGFDFLFEIPYDEYVDEDGEPIFRISRPHKALQKMIKRF